MNWTHDGLAEDLASHIRGLSDRMVWTDMQLGPAGSSRPDVYTIPFSYSRFMPLAYECKVSVSDFRADVTKGKYTDYLKYASGVIFAAPANLLKKTDIPSGCGLIQRSEAGWRVAKAPTLVRCPELPRDAWLKLLMDGGRRDHERRAAQDRHARLTLNEYLALAKVRARFGEVVAAAVSDLLAKTDHRIASLYAAAQREIDRADDHLKLAREARSAQTKQDEQRISKAHIDLAAAVGLSAESSVWDLVAAAKSLATRADESQRNAELISALRNARRALRQFESLEDL